MKIETVSIEKLTPYEKNPRIISDNAIKKVKESIDHYGFIQPIVASKDNIICIGHTRFQAAKLSGLKTVPVLYLDLDKEKFAKLNIADNKSNQFTEFDHDLLFDNLHEFDSLDGTLFDDYDIMDIKNDDSISGLYEDKNADEEEENLYDQTKIKNKPSYSITFDNDNEYQSFVDNTSKLTKKLNMEIKDIIIKSIEDLIENIKA